MRRRVLEWFDAASESDRIAGESWYAGALESANGMGDDPTIAAGVIAAYSPRCPWKQNLKWAADTVAAAINGEPCPAYHTTTMRTQAWRIANGEHPLDVMEGPKVRAFFANIMGDQRRVTIDVWAARAAEGKSDPRSPSGRRYALIERAYVEAAAMRGVTPAAMQATVWCAIRGSAD